MVNKQEIVNRIAEKVGMSKKVTGEFMDAFIDVVADALANDEKIGLYGFVSMETVNVEPKIMKNPQNQESVEVAAHKKVRMKVGEGLKNFINNK